MNKEKYAKVVTSLYDVVGEELQRNHLTLGEATSILVEVLISFLNSIGDTIGRKNYAAVTLRAALKLMVKNGEHKE